MVVSKTSRENDAKKIKLLQWDRYLREISHDSLEENSYITDYTY